MTPGSQIVYYGILSKIGEGGMGAVYRATDAKLNRDWPSKFCRRCFRCYKIIYSTKISKTIREG